MKYNLKNIYFIILCIISNPIFLIRFVKIKFIADSYIASIFFGLISIFFILVFFGNIKKLTNIIKIIFIPFIIFSILFAVFTVSEYFSKIKLNANQNYSSKMSENFKLLFKEDKFSGYKLSNNFSDTISKKTNNNKVYKAFYKTDSLGRKETYGNLNSDKNHLVFFGCSYTFGDGISNSKIFTQRLKNLLKEKSSVYNYGVPGYGTQQMLAKLQFGNIEKEILQQNGKAIYVYVPGIISRNIGAFSTFGWSNIYPCYSLENNKLKYFRSSVDAFPLRAKFFKIMNHFHLFRYLKINRNFDYPKINNEHIKLTSEMIIESKKIYQSKFKNSEFYVLIFPHLHSKDKNTETLKKHLLKDSIKIIDLSNFADTILDKSIPLDGHPSENLHKEISLEIFKILK